MTPATIIRLIRVRHWIKNLIVLFPLFFALKMGDAQTWLLAGLTMAAFCLGSSAIYVVNDIHDRQRDREHPRKKDRPIASGAVSVPTAWGLSALMTAGAIALALAVNPLVLAILGTYLVMQVAYTFLLKHKMIVDVICIALGFVLRAVAGAAGIHVEASPWLIVCTFTICLFMGFCKRRNELATLGDAATSAKHRPTLAGYSPELLTHLITLSAGLAILSYLLYATSPVTIARFQTDLLFITLPVIIYAVCRFAMISMVGRFSDPVELIARDWPFQLAVTVWAVATFVIITRGQAIHDWFVQTLRGS